jgi:hypothetical protein
MGAKPNALMNSAIDLLNVCRKPPATRRRRALVYADTESHREPRPGLRYFT